MIDWQAISTEFGPQVWRTSYRLLGSEADAADCFQETFLSALGVSRRQEVANWGGMLQKLATSRALDALRRRKREMKYLREASDWEQVATDQIGPDRDAADREQMESLRAALGRLAPQQSEVFCLRHLSGMSYEEIAKELEISVDGVGVSLHRAKVRLRELLVSACAGERK